MDFDDQAGQQPGLEIWRIEKLKPVRVEQKSYGTFFSGDCYILLHTIEKKGTIEQDLFFWLGDECSQDEKGAVAYQTVFLDDKLGGKPVQYREVQGHESQKFMSLFKHGIEIRDGGVDSAFRHVDPTAYKPRLFQLKGKRHVRVQQVKLARESLNDGDVFILDKGMKIYQWNGAAANKYEKYKGLEITTKIKNEERGGKPELIVLESKVNDQKETEFWDELGGIGPVKSADEGGSDEESKHGETKLLRINGSSFEEVASGKLTRNLLTTEDVFIVDSGTEVFVWTGKGSSPQQRKEGLKLGGVYLQQQGRPDWTPMSRINETGETPAFKALFSVWDPPRVVSFEEKGSAAKDEMKVDSSALYQQTARAEEKMADDATGSYKIWRIENFQRVAVPEDNYGQFYMGDSYVLLYQYQVKGKDNYIIYFWQGRESSTDEKGASALFAVQMDDELGGDPVQVRVVQDKEPNHFLSLFKGRMIVHQGGMESGFKNRKRAGSVSASGTSLYHVKGTNAVNTRAVQVDTVASSLNSGDCFVLLTDTTEYIWRGKGSNDTERQFAANIASILQDEREVVTLEEGSEDEAFWAALGGKAEYPTSVTLAGGEHEPRLFHASNISGHFKVEEVFDFSQDDLINDDVMMLDTYESVFVWLGHNAQKDEKDNAMRVALDYVKNAPDGRDPNTPVYKVIAGAEPPVFTCHFRGWNEDQARDFSDPYAAKLAQLKSSGDVGTESKSSGAPHAHVEKKVVTLEKVTTDDIGFAKGHYPYEDLKANKIANVDPSRKESYLNDAEFQAVFKMGRVEFDKLPKWKKDQTKKAVGLF